MWFNLVFVLYALSMLTPSIKGLRVIELSKLNYSEDTRNEYELKRRFLDEDKKLDLENSKEILTDTRVDSDDIVAQSETNPTFDSRKTNYNNRAKDCDDPKEKMLKDKIYKLVEQTIADADRKMATIAEIKERGKELAPFKIGFILNMVKKTREVQNELFNVAVKHRDDWKSLEQMKIFELMVHTNVDTTNLVRQMVEIHVSYSNHSHAPYERKRVQMLRKAQEHVFNAEAFKNIEIMKNRYKLPLTGL